MKRNWPLIFSRTLYHGRFYFLLTFAAFTLEEIVEESNPVLRGLLIAAVTGLIWAVPMTVACFVDGLIITRSSDAPYFCGPRLGHPRPLSQDFVARWILILGTILLGLYWYFGLKEIYFRAILPHGIIWVAPQVAFTVEYVWTLLWLAVLVRRRTWLTGISWLSQFGLTVLLFMEVGYGVSGVE